MGITVLGRMNPRSEQEVLSANSYYTYLPLLSLLIGLYLLWASALVGKKCRNFIRPERLYTCLLLGLLTLSAFSGAKIFSVTDAEKDYLRPVRVLAKDIKSLISRHQAEPDFSFSLSLEVHTSKVHFHGLSVPYLLFQPQLNNHNPLYLFTLQDGKLVAQHREEQKTGKGRPGNQVFPDLVELGSTFNIFYYEGRYYAQETRYGYFNPAKADYDNLIVDRTLTGARTQAQRQWPPPFPSVLGRAVFCSSLPKDSANW
jgi:hypothetical protein